MLDLTIYEKGLKNNIERAKAQNIILPTIDQQMHPEKVPEKILAKLKNTGLWDIDPVNLFRITWKNEQKESGGLFHGPNYIVIPPELSGVKCRIICMIGKWFPTGCCQKLLLSFLQTYLFSFSIYSMFYLYQNHRL